MSNLANDVVMQESELQASRLVAQGRVSLPQTLSPDRRRVVEELLKHSGETGRLVGVMLGAATWDVRPIVESQLGLSMLRASDPELPKYQERLNSFRALLLRLGSLGQAAPEEIGEFSGRLWSRRALFTHTLEDAAAQEMLAPGTAFVRALVEAVILMLEGGVLHGHLSASNIGLGNSGSAVILDGGFHMFTLQRTVYPREMAPELRAGSAASVQSEIYSLGAVLSRLPRSLLTAAESEIVTRMLVSHPNGRPRLSEIRTAFGLPQRSAATTAVKPSTPAARLLTEPSTEVRSRALNKKKAGGKAKVGGAQQVGQQLRGQLQSIIATVILLIVVVIALRGWSAVLSGPSTHSEDAVDLPFADYWKSGQSSLMEKVAYAAVVRGNNDAREAIIDDAKLGQKRPLVRNELIQTALNPAWAEDLSPTDITAVLRLALTNLIPEQERVLPPLDSVHPGVLLAVLASSQLQARAQSLGGLPLKKMFELPEPYGSAYSALAATGVQHLGESSAVGLAHILSGAVNGDSIIAVLLDQSRGAFLRDRMTLLIGLFDAVPGLDRATYDTVLATREDPLSVTLAWFDGDDTVNWLSQGPGVRLSLAAELWPASPLEWEQTVDLLSFPLLSVRLKAAQLLKENLNQAGIKNTIDSIAKVDGGLTRLQIVALMHALTLEGESKFTFVAKWFETKPDPFRVLELLLARNDVAGVDAFDVEAARYLNRSVWQVSDAVLAQLANHTEPLARALAYSKLDPQVSTQRKILDQRINSEQNPRLKEQLRQKLEG